MLDFNDDFWWNSHLDNASMGHGVYAGLQQLKKKEEKYAVGTCHPVILEELADGTPVRTLYRVKECKKDLTGNYDWALRVELDTPHLKNKPSIVMYFSEYGDLIDSVI